MKEIQRSLAFPALVAPDRAQLRANEKRLQVQGRPRRIKPGFSMTPAKWRKAKDLLAQIEAEQAKSIPEELVLGEAVGVTGPTPSNVFAEFAVSPDIIKVSLTSSVLSDIDRLRKRIEGNATEPDFIRIAVEKFIADGPADLEEAPQKKQKTRCVYRKILFPPATLEAIGHQKKGKKEATGLCGKLGLTRQGVILLAVRQYLRQAS